MNRRDQYGSAQQPGGNRDEDNSWEPDAPRQASQWSDTGRQAGGGWSQDDNQRGAQGGTQGGQYENRQFENRRSDWDTARNRSRDFEDRWVDPERSGSRSDYRGEHHDRGDFGGRRYGASAYGGSFGGRDFEGNRERGGYGGYGASDYGRSRSYSQSWGQDYRRDDRSQGSRGGYSSRPFDASGGQDFSSFTSEDYGGRDFTADRGGGLSGGMHPSDTYRPASLFGSGSSANWPDRSSDDYSSWREHGERRGFLARAGDEIASWFGDDDAARRREQDHRGRGPSDYTRSDERIREDVNDKLTHDWRVDATAVRVSVKNGEVSLDGTVSSRDAKRRAEDVADGISGVKHVQNNLRVQQSASTDQGSWNQGTAAGIDPSGSWSGGSAAGLAGSEGSSAGSSSTTGGSGSLSGSTTNGATTSSSGTSITGGASTARGTTDKTT